MDTKTVIAAASRHLGRLGGTTLDVLTIARPTSLGAAMNLAKIVSKLSPLLGNMIEFSTVDLLNEQPEFAGYGRWKRQDPGFPDAIFEGSIRPTPGFEIKAWFPLATEITGRFKDSQEHFAEDHIHVALVAWLPEHIVYGQPKLLGACIVSGLSVAQARDTHYHNPPDYLVIEPGDTSARTSNLRQTNTSGYKWQGTDTEFRVAETMWGTGGRAYSTATAYQRRVADLRAKFDYRLDTNYAKLDRIVHPGIEKFKTSVLSMTINGLTIKQWARTFASEDIVIEQALKKHLNLK